MGLQSGGVPIKFSSYHTFQFPVNATVNALIQERSRSVKSIFSCVRRSPAQLDGDAGATIISATPSTTLQNFQYRIGGRYFPASPVQVSINYGDNSSNGGSEAFVELQKALNTVGDYRLSSAVNSNRWAYPSTLSASQTVTSGLERDYKISQLVFDTSGTMFLSGDKFGPAAGDLGSGCFTMATSLETSNGMEISGLNAEEQSDISLQANWSANAWSVGGNNLPYLLEVYTYYDAMLVLRENNVVELIQ